MMTPKIHGSAELLASLELELKCCAVYAPYSSVARSGTDQQDREVRLHFEFAYFDFTVQN